MLLDKRFLGTAQRIVHVCTWSVRSYHRRAVRTARLTPDRTLKVVATHHEKQPVTLLKKLIGHLIPGTMLNLTSDSCSVLRPPSDVRGQKVLDKNAFQTTVSVPTWNVPVSAVNKISSLVKPYLLKTPGIKAVAELAENDSRKDSFRLFLFNPAKFSSISEEVLTEAKSCGVDVVADERCQFDIGYENFLYSDVLGAILPVDTAGVGGFSIVGHIVHLNLRENLLDYKHIIGEVLLDKLKQVKTVVNKVNTIDNEYRNFEMELLAGESDFITICKENGFSFEFDFSKVYWNPRLGTEHDRVVSLMREGDVLFDVFAGVGPFAVPAAKKKCAVYANDLNPESYKWLCHNMTKNKVKGEHYEYNLDGRIFIKDVLKPKLIDFWRGPRRSNKVHICMNLPALAVEFLDVFSGLMCGESLNIDTPPVVHCYCFCHGPDLVSEARSLAERHIGHELPDETTRVRAVRDVAPNKHMMCVSLQLTADILLHPGDEPSAKKKRLDSESDPS